MKNKNKRWVVSSKYPNVILVAQWRHNMNEDDLVQQSTPATKYIWRKFLLDIHTKLIKFLNWCWLPITRIMEKFNGTSQFRTALDKMEASEKKVSRSI